MSYCSFVHLRLHTAYSLLEGAVRIKEAVKLCKQHGMPAIAITDSNNLFGSLEFSQAAAEAGIQPVIGALFSFKPQGDNRHAHRLAPDQLLLLAKDRQGYDNLLTLASRTWLSPADGQGPLLDYADLEDRNTGLIALTAGTHGVVGKHLLQGKKPAAEEALLKLSGLFPGRLYVELMRHGTEDEKRTEGAFLEFAQKHNLPLVATNDIHFIGEEMYEAHDALLCIADGKYVMDAERRRLTPEHRFKSPDEMRALFADIPEALENTVAIARRCAVMSPSRKPILPRFTDASGAGEEELLRRYAREGLENRLKEYVFPLMKETPSPLGRGLGEGEKGRDNKVPQPAPLPKGEGEIVKPYRERLEYELDMIVKTGFPGYFLIVSDFIRWSKEHGIPVGPGRGSGAGSLVAWALQITDLDPLRYGLLFERFLNPERVSMPDFDIDFCQDRRDEVIRYVQQRYGSDKVAQIITFGKLQARAVLRDVGRVLQLPYTQVDGICKLVPNNPAAPVTLQEAIDMEPMFKAAIKSDEAVQRMVDIALKLEGLYRHASTHAAGVVIGDRPLSELVPMYRDPKSDMPVVQYSMKYAESAGLVKFDFLGLKTLTVLQKAVEMAAARRFTIDLLKLPEGDKKTYDMLSAGDTVGVFQLESAGMRDTLRKLRPDCLEDIIALVSLYRPGPMENIPTYIARKHGHEKPEYLHPKLEQALKETFGVIIYQEQVMQIAQLLAGYSLGEADLLRRAMGKKIRAEMEAQREVFVSRAMQNGVPEEQARSIFDLIAKFAEYGFNKSHAAAYAVIAYQTAYMKANFPVEFFAASMTYDMHNTDKLSIFREAAQRSAIALLPPDVNRSGALFGVEVSGARCQVSESDASAETRNLKPETLAIRYALGAVRNVGIEAMRKLVAQREAGGPYTDIFDLAERLDSQSLNKRSLEFLIKSGAFDSIHRNRRQLMESVDTVTNYCSLREQERASAQVSLFDAVGSDAAAIINRPALAKCDDWSPLEQLDHEFEAIGFYLSAHPLNGYAPILKKLGVTNAVHFLDKLNGTYRPIKVAGIVTSFKVKVSPRGRFGFLSLSDETGVFEVSVFKEELINQNRALFDEGNLLVIQADGKAEESGARLIATAISRLEDMAKQHKVADADARTLRIRAEENLDVMLLKQKIGGNVEVGAVVALSVRLADGKSVRIRLPGQYFAAPSLLTDLQALPGVVDAE